MNVVKCLGGHFFDGDIYKSCPHCGASVSEARDYVGESSLSKQPKKGLLNMFKDKSKTENKPYDVQVQPNYGFQSVHGSGQFDISADVAGSDASTGVIMMDSIGVESNIVDFDDSDTVSIFDEHMGGEEITESLYFNCAVKTDREIENVYEPQIKTEKDFQAVSVNKESLTDTIRNASAHNEGKTMSFFSAMTGGNVHESQEVRSIEPVVGWLVSIEGKHFGESFHLVAGKNSIGRNNGNNIVLDMDNSVSREKHTVVVYEPKMRKFYVQPGDGSGLTYLNEEYITETKMIEERDILEVGSSKLLFIPLCDDSFTWEDYIKSNAK